MKGNGKLAAGLVTVVLASSPTHILANQSIINLESNLTTRAQLATISPMERFNLAYEGDKYFAKGVVETHRENFGAARRFFDESARLYEKSDITMPYKIAATHFFSGSAAYYWAQKDKDIDKGTKAIYEIAIERLTKALEMFEMLPKSDGTDDKKYRAHVMLAQSFFRTGNIREFLKNEFGMIIIRQNESDINRMQRILKYLNSVDYKTFVSDVKKRYGTNADPIIERIDPLVKAPWNITLL